MLRSVLPAIFLAVTSVEQEPSVIFLSVIFSCGATLYTPLCVCLFVCLSVPRFVCPLTRHLPPQLQLDIRACFISWFTFYNFVSWSRYLFLLYLGWQQINIHFFSNRIAGSALVDPLLNQNWHLYFVTSPFYDDKMCWKKILRGAQIFLKFFNPIIRPGIWYIWVTLTPGWLI
jgi:hypothetical protein